MKYSAPSLLLAVLCSAPALAGNQSLDAAIGGGLGGAAGAAIGSELGGRQGAIVGGALGAATGAAVTTSGHREPEYVPYDPPPKRYYRSPPAPDYFCPPGQAKKRRCGHYVPYGHR
jgi:hypothetical protein